jgi:hypothetical protein
MAKKKTATKKSTAMKNKTASPRKITSPSLSSLASKILSGEKKATQADAKKLAASVLSQDEIQGQPSKR